MGGGKKTAGLIAAFFLFYLLFGSFNFLTYGLVNNTQDFMFHWGRIQGHGPDSAYWNQFDNEIPNMDYPPAYHILFGVFSFNQLAFYLMNLVLVLVLIPILLFKIAGKWWAVLIYFLGVSLPHQILYGATYPQALILLYFLLYIRHRKNWGLLLCLTILSYFTHSTGLFLFAAIWGLEIINLLLNKYDPSIPGIVLIGWMKPVSLQGWREFLSIFILQLPLPVFYFGLKKLRSGFFALLIALSFIAATTDLRAISVAQILFCILSGKAISECSWKIKAGFVLFLCFQGLFYLLDFAGGTWKFIVLN